MLFRAWCVLLLFLPGILLAEDEAQAPTMGIKFPETLAGLALVKTTNYEKQTPGLGVGVSYRAEKQKADIYIYSGGLENLPDGIDSIELQKHFKEVMGDVIEMEKQGHYENVKFTGPPDRVEIGQHPFLHAELSFVHQKEPRISHTYLTVIKGNFLKIRFTYFASDAEEGKKTLEALLRSLGMALTPRAG